MSVFYNDILQQIVYDQEKKRWINIDEDSNDPSNEFKPPPKLSDMISKIDTQYSSGGSIHSMSLSSSRPNNLKQSPNLGSELAPTSNSTADNVNSTILSQSNMFKLQRGRSKYYKKHIL